MNFGKKTACGRCGKEFSFMLDKHDVEDCCDHLRAKVEVGEEAIAALEEWRKHDSAPDCVACAALDAALAGGGE